MIRSLRPPQLGSPRRPTPPRLSAFDCRVTPRHPDYLILGADLCDGLHLAGNGACMAREVLGQLLAAGRVDRSSLASSDIRCTQTERGGGKHEHRARIWPGVITSAGAVAALVGITLPKVPAVRMLRRMHYHSMNGLLTCRRAIVTSSEIAATAFGPGRFREMRKCRWSGIQSKW